MDFFLQRSEVYFLLLIRLLSFFSVAPFFGHRSLPHQGRIALALLLAVLLFPYVQAPHAVAANIFAYALLAGKEVLIGLVLGFAAEFIFYAVLFAGQILSFLFGFAIVTSFDPNTSNQTSIISKLKWLFAIIIFLIIDGHFLLIEAMAKSLQIIPLVGGKFPDSLAQYVLRLSAQVFVIAVQISAPALVTLFLTNVSLAMLARMVPQMNVFVVGFPLTITVGLISLMVILPIFFVFMQHLMEVLRENLMTILRLIGG